MTGASILGSSFDCECGRRHSVGVRQLLLAPDVFERLPGTLALAGPGRRVALFADSRTWAAAGSACHDCLQAAGWTCAVRIIPDLPHGGPVCDDLTRDALLSDLPEADVFLAVGAGVVNDLVKWLSSDVRVPYAVFATAASMNGYTSVNIAPTLRGVKSLLPGTEPFAVMAHPDVLRDAPAALTASGLGDVLAKSVSVTDWRMNNLLFGEYYCPYCARMIREIEPGYLERPESIREREASGIKALFDALVDSGLSLTLAGTSFPASGGEHMISHALDMTAAVHGVPHDYHGRQVGVGTIFAAALYGRLLRLEAPVFRAVSEPADAGCWREITGHVEAEYAAKRARIVAAVERLRLPGAWAALRAELAPMSRDAAQINDCLRRAGAAHRISDIGCGRERFLQAVLHAHQMRARYTVIDLARAAGILPGAAEEIISEFLME